MNAGEQMEALEIPGPIIEFIYMMIIESRRVAGQATARECYDGNVSYVKPIKVAYGFSRRICVTA
jgi:hypothetical protein